ncbi:hypothetical protein Bbelb_447330, partial [Branchiostoma belcheri]
LQYQNGSKLPPAVPLSSQAQQETGKHHVSGLASMFEEADLHLSPAGSPPLGGTKSPHRSLGHPHCLLHLHLLSSAASSDSFVAREQHHILHLLPPDSIHDELLPGQRPGGPRGVPPLPGRNKSGAPPPPPTTSIPSIKAKTRDMKSRQLPAPPPGGAHGPTTRPSRPRSQSPVSPSPSRTLSLSRGGCTSTHGTRGGGAEAG